MTELQTRLQALGDAAFADFQWKLMPTADRETMLGIRLPILRSLEKELRGTPEAEALIKSLPHAYFEESMLHALIVNQIRDPAACVSALDAFLPYVDNWAVCDTLNPVCFKKHPVLLPAQAQRWMESAHPYTCRFGIAVLMRFYLDDAFDPRYLGWAAAIRSDEYYVNMMIAWYFATALAKQYDAALPYLTEKKLAPWTHGKAIQKAIESYRVPDAHKDALRALRIPRTEHARQP